MFRYSKSKIAFPWMSSALRSPRSLAKFVGGNRENSSFSSIELKGIGLISDSNSGNLKLPDSVVRSNKDSSENGDRSSELSLKIFLSLKC